MFAIQLKYITNGGGPVQERQGSNFEYRMVQRKVRQYNEYTIHYQLLEKCFGKSRLV